MAMIEQNPQIFGLIAKLGSRETFATMGIKTAIINLHREEARQERRGEKVVTNDLKYQENYVWKYSVVLAGNYHICAILLRHEIFKIKYLRTEIRIEFCT
jgi:hypothetical protein